MTRALSRTSVAAVATLLAMVLAGCSDSGGDDDAQPSSDPTPTPGASESASETPEAAGRLVVQPSGGSACLDGLKRGEVLAFTGPHLVVEDGPVTIAGAGSTDVRVIDVEAVQFTPGGSRQPAMIAAESLDELDPEGRPYLPDTEGALDGQTFEAGTGVVPLVEIRMVWPVTGPGVDPKVSVDQPVLRVTWQAEGGESQVLDAPIPVELHSAEDGCRS